MNSNYLMLGAALTVGVAGGFIAGKNSGAQPAPAAEEGQAVQTHSSQRRGANGAGVAGGKDNRSGRQGFEEISKLPGSNARIQALADFYGSLSVQQLEEEARKLEDLPLNERMMASILLFGRWGEVDPHAAMEFASTMGFSAMFVRPTVLQSWASVDPVNAAKYYEQNPREFAMMGMGGMMGGGGRGRGGMGGGFQSASAMIAGEWAKQDAQAALAWAGGLERDKSTAISSVIGQVAKDDPAKAAQMLAGLGTQDSGNAYRSVAAAYGAKNFAEAQTWIQGLPADQQADAMAAAISGLAKSDPQAAATQVANMQAGEAKDDAVGDVVGAMARQDPARAAEFLSQNASPEAQGDSMRQIMPAWVNKDPAAAYNYANNLPAGGVRDSAIRSYLWSNNSAEPSTLVSIAETITNEDDRSRTVGWMVSRWMREDETAARAYVQQSTNLSDRMKEHILGEGGR